MNKPILTEPGVRYYLSRTLLECRKFKDKNINVIVNLSMFLMLIAILGGFLYYNYKGNANIAEIKFRQRQKEEYILTKLRQVASYKSNNNQNLFTSLPRWN